LAVIAPRQPFIDYSVDHHGDRFWIVTNLGAQSFRLMDAPVSDPRQDNWREVLPGRQDVTLEAVFAFQNDLVVIERKEGLRHVRLSMPDGVSDVRYIAMPEAAYSLIFENNPEFATRTFRLRYTSLVTPSSVVDYDMAAGHWELVKQDIIPSGYDSSQYQTERLFATTPDGQRVPISLVYRKGMERNGRNPLLLNGYGSYGYSLDPAFNSNRLSLLDRGFVIALAHVRGGGDLGRTWYEDGKLLKKKNTFTDFIACAEHLIVLGYTSRDKLSIMGGSAGGLLVGAVMILRPDLCKAVVAQVPFVDPVNTMSDPSIPLTTREYDQWGNPEDPAYFDYMMSYSPYDNLQPIDYPDILLTTSLNDPRVAFWEPAKFTAKMRVLKASDGLILLKTDFGAGHGGASGRYNALKDVALIYTFLIGRIGTEEKNGV
jgi:oligopeptidase B